MPESSFKHLKTIKIPDPDFMPIYLQPLGPDHIIALQTWCAFILDVESESLVRVDYPAWAWNVTSTLESEPALSIFFELRKTVERCPVDAADGKVGKGEPVSDRIPQPAASPPHMINEDAIWFTKGKMGHTLVASRYDRMTDLISDISKIDPTDFFLPGPEAQVYLHRWDVGLMLPHPVDQPELVVNYRVLGCKEPRGVSFDANGRLWVLDEIGPKLFEVDMEDRTKTRIHDLSVIHGEQVDPKDPSPYPWHSCIWWKDKLVVGCCDSPRFDILTPALEP